MTSSARKLDVTTNDRPGVLAHKNLGAAVFAAYGRERGIRDEELLARLLRLNLDRAESFSGASMTRSTVTIPSLLCLVVRRFLFIATSLQRLAVIGTIEGGAEFAKKSDTAALTFLDCDLVFSDGKLRKGRSCNRQSTTIRKIPLRAKNLCRFA